MRLGRKGQRFFFVDFESSGLDMERSEIVEVGFVITDEWLNVIDTFHSLVASPEQRTQPIAVPDPLPAYRIHGITAEQRATAPTPQTVGIAVEKLATRYTSAAGSKPVLISDCLQFEWQFMRRLLAYIGGGVDICDVFHFCGWDTSLLLEASGVDDPQPMAHRALADAGLVHAAVVRALERMGTFDRMNPRR